MTTLSKSSPSIPPWLGGGLPGLVRAAVRRGLTIGCVVTIGAVPGIVILDPECTAKTYPDFFADLARIIQKADRGTRNDQCK